MNIEQASAASRVSQRMIRHYKKIGLILAAVRRESGHRDYTETDVHRLRFIANSRDLGFPIDKIRSLLALWDNRERPSGEVKALAMARTYDIARKVAALQALQRTLIDLAEHCHEDNRPECPILDELYRKGSKGDSAPAA